MLKSGSRNNAQPLIRSAFVSPLKGEPFSESQLQLGYSYHAKMQQVTPDKSELLRWATQINLKLLMPAHIPKMHQTPHACMWCKVQDGYTEGLAGWLLRLTNVRNRLKGSPRLNLAHSIQHTLHKGVNTGGYWSDKIFKFRLCYILYVNTAIWTNFFELS